MLRCPMSLIPPTDDDDLDAGGVAWREPRGFGAYLVSYLGQIKSFNDHRRDDGYILNAPSGRTLVFDDGGNRVTRMLSHLVMLAWHDPRPGSGFTVGRITDDPTDNRAVNLFWESRREQNLRANRPVRNACPRGHAYQGDSFFINREGYKCCRVCSRAHWWASRFRRLARERPFDGRIHAPITVEVVLVLAPDGRFPSGPPDVSEVLITAARYHYRVAKETAQLDSDTSRGVD